MLKNIIYLTLITFALSADWNYLNSGASWVGANNGTCGADQTNQSPIDAISSSGIDATLTRGGTINLPAKGTTMKVDEVNNGHTIVINPETGKYLFTCELMIEGDTKPVKFNALQFHFHAPSENYVDGVQGELEIHFVMKCDSCDATKLGNFNYAVLGFIFKLDQYAPKSTFLDKVITNFPTSRLLERYTEDSLDDYYMRHLGERKLATTKTKAVSDFDINSFFDLVPTTYQFLNFRGGLTTPPCTQMVNWFLARKMIPVNQDQLSKFQALWVNSATCTKVTGCGNNRELQLLMNRKVYKSTNTLKVASSTSDPDSTSKTWLIVILIIVCLLLLIMLVATIFKAGASGAQPQQATYNAANKKEANENQEA